MSSRKRKAVDDQIEAEVLADLHDPAAWDEAIYVPPSKSPRPAWLVAGRHLELSARFHVLSVLHRFGLEANLTNSHHDNVDITVVQAPGRALTINVQTLIGTNKWHVRPFSARKHHYMAFVLFSSKATENPSAVPEVIVFPSVRLKALLEQYKSNPSNVQVLAREFGATNPWRQFITEAA
jgi:hypothetical protein